MASLPASLFRFDRIGRRAIAERMTGVGPACSRTLPVATPSYAADRRARQRWQPTANRTCGVTGPGRAQATGSQEIRSWAGRHVAEMRGAGIGTCRSRLRPSAPQLHWRDTVGDTAGILRLPRGIEGGTTRTMATMAEQPKEIRAQEMPAQDVLVIGAGPAGLTAAYELSKHGVARDHPRSRLGRRRHRPHRRARRLPLRHRRAPLLHQGQGDRGPLGRDARRADARPPPPVADLLRRQVLRLPAQGHQRPEEHGPAHRRPVHGQLRRRPPAGPSPTRRTSSSGSPTSSAPGSTRCSSRATPKRSGASPAPRSAPTGPPSASRA